jgi:hypothetical protein
VPTERLRPIAREAVRGRVASAPPGRMLPYALGTGATDYACGHCGAVLVTGAPPGGRWYPAPMALRPPLLRCPCCGGYNDAP